MLTRGPRNPTTNPNSIAEDEEFEITYSLDFPFIPLAFHPYAV